jgi:endonuclease/exonuclease/phosphatase family metal-dependent hydrolase
MFGDKYADLIKEYKIKDTRGNLYTKDLRYSDYFFIDNDIKINSFSVPNLELSDHLPMLLKI